MNAIQRFNIKNIAKLINSIDYDFANMILFYKNGPKDVAVWMGKIKKIIVNEDLCRVSISLSINSLRIPLGLSVKSDHIYVPINAPILTSHHHRDIAIFYTGQDYPRLIIAGA